MSSGARRARRFGSAKSTWKMHSSNLCAFRGLSFNVPFHLRYISGDRASPLEIILRMPTVYVSSCALVVLGDCTGCAVLVCHRSFKPRSSVLHRSFDGRVGYCSVNRLATAVPDVSSFVLLQTHRRVPRGYNTTCSSDL